MPPLPWYRTSYRPTASRLGTYLFGIDCTPELELSTLSTLSATFARCGGSLSTPPDPPGVGACGLCLYPSPPRNNQTSKTPRRQHRNPVLNRKVYPMGGLSHGISTKESGEGLSSHVLFPYPSLRSFLRQGRCTRLSRLVCVPALSPTSAL